MAEVRRLDGTVVDTAKLGRNENVARVLDKFVKRNEAGRIAAIAVITLTPEGWYSCSWQWHADSYGFPWSMALEGALARLQAEMAVAAVNGPEMEEPKPEPPDGA